MNRPNMYDKPIPRNNLPPPPPPPPHKMNGKSSKIKIGLHLNIADQNSGNFPHTPMCVYLLYSKVTTIC